MKGFETLVFIIGAILATIVAISGHALMAILIMLFCIAITVYFGYDSMNNDRS